MVLVEALELIVSDATGHSRNVIDVWLSHHRRHRRIGIAYFEFGPAMRFPKIREAVGLHLRPLCPGGEVSKRNASWDWVATVAAVAMPANYGK
jgi:hypothetical protein